MKKIPVGATIAHAYRFALQDFFKIFGIMWLPTLIMVASALALTKPLLALTTAITGSPSNVWHALTFLLPLYLAMFVFVAMIIVGVTQHALGLRTGSPFYYFSLGRPLWRLIAAFLLIILIIFGTYIALLLAGIILGFAGALLAKIVNLSLGTGAIAALAAVAFILVFGAYIYAMTRLTFLLAPVVIAEEKIGLKRSWQIGRGNFWRMFLILMSLVIPVIILELAFFFGFLGLGLPPMVPVQATPEQVAAAQTAMANWNMAILTRSLRYWYVTYPFWTIFSVIFYGAACGAQAFAYRAITESAPVPGHTLPD